MQKAIELEYNHKVLRGMEHIPDSQGTALPAVILFHGFTGTKLEPHRLFLKISRALCDAQVASFRFDFSGSGESDGNFEDMTLDTEYEEAKAILNWVRADPRIDPTRVSLLGLSMGGLVASLLAGDCPEDVHKLALLAPAGNMPDLIGRAMMAYQAASPDVDLRQAKVFDYGGNLVGREFAESLQNLRVFERAGRYPGDVLLMHGTKDESVPAEVSIQYRDLAYKERAQVHMIEGADHTFNSTPWESQVLSAVSAFFR